MTMTTRPQDETVADLVELLDDNLQEMFEEPVPGFGGPSSQKPRKPGVMALMRSVVGR